MTMPPIATIDPNPQPQRRSRISVAAMRTVGFLCLLAIPLAAIGGLHFVSNYAESERVAAYDLAQLNSAVHQAAAAVGWGLVTRQPAESISAGFVPLRQQVQRDLDAVRADNAAPSEMATLNQSVPAFMESLAGAAALPAIGGGEPNNFGQVTAFSIALTEHAALLGAIDQAVATEQADADRAQWIAEAAIWLTVITATSAMVLVFVRIERQRRRAAAIVAEHTGLVESEREFRLLFNANPMPMWVYDPDTLRFLEVNDAAVSHYGYSREEMSGMTLLDIRPASERMGFRERMLTGAPGEKPKVFRHLLKDGRVLDVEVTATMREFQGRRAFMSMGRDVTEERLLQKALRHRAFHDTLTDLANRDLIADRFATAMTSADEVQYRPALVLLDVDGFKTVNDAYGHDVGDRVLVALAHRLRAVVRTADTPARMGGDEFAILLDEGGTAMAAAVGQRAIDELGAPLQLDGITVHLSVSGGVTVCDGDTATWGRMLHEADIALYEAKRTGKGQLGVFRPGLRSIVLDRLEMASALRGAAGRGEISLAYQPIVSTAAGHHAVLEVEALARWTHPTRGNVPPDRFIAVAEETGLMPVLGTWILRTACEQMRRWELCGAPFAVSVNVSAHQLLDADFVPTVQAVLEDTGLSPDRLILEVTETVLLEDRAAATRRLGELRVMAVRIALDDFGAGYSSLSYLNDLPLDVVKLDRSFTAMLTGLSPRRKLVLAIVRMLDTLDVQTVCEGVETAEQLDYVTALGMDSVQGYHLCRPVPADDLIEAIADIETAGRAHTAA